MIKILLLLLVLAVLAYQYRDRLSLLWRDRRALGVARHEGRYMRQVALYRHGGSIYCVRYATAIRDEPPSLPVGPVDRTSDDAAPSVATALGNLVVERLRSPVPIVPWPKDRKVRPESLYEGLHVPSEQALLRSSRSVIVRSLDIREGVALVEPCLVRDLATGFELVDKAGEVVRIDDTEAFGLAILAAFERTLPYGPENEAGSRALPSG